MKLKLYDISKADRIKLTDKIKKELCHSIEISSLSNLKKYFSNEDTYIRKAAYLSLGRIYFERTDLNNKIIFSLETLLTYENTKIRQTTINSAGEIGIMKFDVVEYLFDKGLTDEHHSVRNAVIGSIKKMSEKNPKPVLKWVKQYLHHPDKEIRREICHGIELRGRTHPQDVLPLLKELQHDKETRVRNTLIHVIGQISYKKNCLSIVIEELKKWENKALVLKAIDEIIDVHERYKNFSFMTQAEAKKFIKENT